RGAPSRPRAPADGRTLDRRRSPARRLGGAASPRYSGSAAAFWQRQNRSARRAGRSPYCMAWPYLHPGWWNSCRPPVLTGDDGLPCPGERAFAAFRLGWTGNFIVAGAGATASRLIVFAETSNFRLRWGPRSWMIGLPTEKHP